MRDGRGARGGHSVIADAVYARPDGSCGDRNGGAAAAFRSSDSGLTDRRRFWRRGFASVSPMLPTRRPTCSIARRAQKSARSIGIAWMDRATPRASGSQPRRRCDCRAYRHSAFRDDAFSHNCQFVRESGGTGSPGKPARGGKFRVCGDGFPAASPPKSSIGVISRPFAGGICVAVRPSRQGGVMMIPVKRILVPTDFSETSDAALKYGSDWRRHSAHSFICCTSRRPA